MPTLVRSRFEAAVTSRLRAGPIVALLGPRQVGKTTLARQVADRRRGQVHWFDLELPSALARLEQPETALAGLRGLVVIDEIQRRPDLFPVLRALVDRNPLPARFLILGSASPALLKQATESLAGRVSYIELTGLGLGEVGADRRQRLWLRGGFPRAFLSRSEADSVRWRADFVRSFVERDLPQLGSGVPSQRMFRFWAMLAHHHGQLWNAAELSRSMGVSEPTVRAYLDLLTQTFMMRQLQPWHENLGKRQVKSPKIYFRDSGLLHQLAGIRTRHDLLHHPKLGASWEGFALEQTLRTLDDSEVYFWATHGGAELDLMVHTSRGRIGYEFKWGDAPRATRSMRVAVESLGLEHLYVVHPGMQRYAIDDRIEALPLDLVPGLSR
jgi:predicted AAA+ superfamily ATPase